MLTTSISATEPSDFPSRFFAGDPEAISAWDELPLWSAPFGYVLLDSVRLAPALHALDLGCGSGFPLLELADRLGPRSHVWGLDPWKPSLDRVRLKIKTKGITHVQVVQSHAERMPFEDGLFDLVVSNNGLNNVEDPLAALRECHRVSTPGAQLVFTANLPGTFEAFYQALESTLTFHGEFDYLPSIHRHIEAKRKSAAEWVQLADSAGWSISRLRPECFTWRFADGTAFLSHAFIRLAFLPSWRTLLPEGLEDALLAELEDRLNTMAQSQGCLQMKVPFLCLICTAK